MKTLATVILILMGVLLVAATPASAAPRTWTGAVSTDWNTAGNWSPAGVPGFSDDLTIPAGAPLYPVITSNVAFKKLIIQNGGSVSTSGTPDIIAWGEVDVQPGGTFSLGSASLTVDAGFTNAGTVNLDSGTLTLNHDLLNNSGTWNPGTSTVIMTGNNNNIQGSAISFYNLTIQNNTSGEVTITVLNDLIVSSGRTLDMGANGLTVLGTIGGGGTVTADAPFMTGATAVSATQVDVQFSETVGLATSQVAGNYAVNNGIGVVSATRDGTDPSLVHLVTSTVSYGTQYTLTVNNVQDAGGTAIAPNSQKYFTPDSNVTYSIAATAGGGGSITPSGITTVTGGSNQGYSIVADTGFHIDSVLVDGVNQGAIPTYTFTTVALDHSIDAFFSVDVFTIDASASAGGSVSPSGSTNVNYSQSQSYSITVDPGHHVDSVLIDGVNMGVPATYDFLNVTANHTIDAYFSIDVFTVNASASAGGSVSPAGATGVNYGGDVSYSVSPDPGFHVDSVVVDGVNMGVLAGYDFLAVSANHSIDAYFSIDVFTVNASASAGGSISPSGSTGVNYGGSVSYSVSADPGYHVDSVVVDGVNQGVPATYDFLNVTANHTIGVYFSVSVFSIFASGGPNGAISPSGAVGVTGGADQAFSISANPGYFISDVHVDSVSVGAVSSYTFTNVVANHLIEAFFSIQQFSVTANAGPNGSVSPSGSSMVDYGGSLPVTITADPGYFITDVFVDSVNVGNPSAYTFTNVTANHLLEAVFSANARPTPVLLISPVHQDTVYSDQLGAVAFRWSGSTDGNPGDLLTYTLTITGPSVNYSSGPLSDTSVTLDLSSVVGLDEAYDWTVSVSDGILTTGGGTFSFFVTSLTGVEEVSGPLPKSYALEQNYPNPFNPTTTIRFDLPERSIVNLRVYNILGVQVMELASGETMEAGTYRTSVDMSTLASGAYFYRIEARSENGRSFQQVKKMVLIR